LRQLGGRGSFVASGVATRRREDPWLCGPGFGRVCLFEAQFPAQSLDRFRDCAGQPARDRRVGPGTLDQLRLGKGDIQLPVMNAGVMLVPKDDAPAGLPVPARTACLLVVRLRSGRRHPVHHQPDIRLVDA